MYPCTVLGYVVSSVFVGYYVSVWDIEYPYEVSMGIGSAPIWICDVCGHEWLQRGDGIPVRCPVRSCWSKRWNDGGGPVRPSKHAPRSRNAPIPPPVTPQAPPAPAITVPKPAPAPVMQSERLCPRCESPLSNWGTSLHCSTCKRNF